MTDEELMAIEKRCDAATPGPWLVRLPIKGESMSVCVEPDIGAYALCECFGQPNIDGVQRYNRIGNAEFIAHARQSVPILIREVRRLDAMLDEASEANASLSAEIERLEAELAMLKGA